MRALILITLLHFSDYHSHAIPFYAEGDPDRGGIARTTGYLAREKRDGALVFNGGDMLNKGAPAWSDHYGCVEWTWLNGVVDAMAFGNHDADYGYAEFAKCREKVTFPILSANTAGFRPYAVFETQGRKIGVFAVAGPDFRSLVRVPELRFGDSMAAARETVRALRQKEKVDFVVMIGHQHAGDDYALARAVPGIDLIFGSHSHVEQELTQIPETETWFISSGQYLTWISRVELRFENDQIRVNGQLVAVDAALPGDAEIEKQVASLQSELEQHPDYQHLFVPFASLESSVSIPRLGQLAVDLMRTATNADLALSAASSFRLPLPAGPLHLEMLRNAMPYDNEVVVAELPARKGRQLLAFVGMQKGDASAFISGAVADGPVRVATTDYLAMVAAGYRDFFADVDVTRTGVRVRNEVRKHLSE